MPAVVGGGAKRRRQLFVEYSLKKLASLSPLKRLRSTNYFTLILNGAVGLNPVHDFADSDW